MTQSATTLTWRGWTAHGSEPAPFTLTGPIEGWEDVEETRSQREPRPTAHGAFDAPGWASERIVTATGQCRDPQQRDELFAQLKSVMTLSGDRPVEDLTISHGGLTLTAGARLTRFRPILTTWGAGVFGWAAQWTCPDPLRYGERTSVATGFPERRGGLRFPLYSNLAGGDVGVLAYGPPSTTGRAVLHNPGTADSAPQFEISGEVGPAGFEIVTVGTGRRLVFAGPVPAGSSLVIDTATGAALIDGWADRAGLLTHRDWWQVPPGESVEFAFLPRGTTSAAQLVASVRPAFW